MIKKFKLGAKLVKIFYRTSKS